MGTRISNGITLNHIRTTETKMNKEFKIGDVVKVNTHRYGTNTGNYGTFNVDKVTPSQIHVYDHNTKEVMKFLKHSKRGIGEHSNMMLEEVEEKLDENTELNEAKISTAQMSHQGKTTIKHIDNPGVELRMAAHDINPGFAGYRDRVALLKAAQAQGKLKEETTYKSATSPEWDEKRVKQFTGKKIEEEVEELDEAHKLNDEVVISYPSLRGVKGRIGEIRHGAYKGAPKTYTVDYQHPKHSEGHISSIQLSSDQFKAHKPGKLGEEVKHLDAKWNHPTKKDYTYDPEISDKHVAGFSDDRGEQTYLKRAALPNNHPAKKLGEEVEHLDELSVDTAKSYKEKVSKNPAPSRTTPDILHKAIRRFAGKEHAEDRIHSDEMKKMQARLGIKEDVEHGEEQLNRETIDEGKFINTIKRGIKNVKRGLRGWDKNSVGPNAEELGNPKDIVNRNKGYSDEMVKKFHRASAPDKARDHSPSGLQKRVLDREMKKRGLTSEDTLDEVVKTENPRHKVGDTVYATSPTNKALTMTGKVTKIGHTLTTVKHKDGTEANYPHKLVSKEYSDLHTDSAKKYKQFQREHLEQTGELLTLTEVKYVVENISGGAGLIAQHAGIDGAAPQGTGKVKKMMGNKVDASSIAKIIVNAGKTKESN